jgi:ribonuclease HI
MKWGKSLGREERAKIFAALAEGLDLPAVGRAFNLTREDLLHLFREVAEFYQAQEGGYWQLFCDGASRGNPGPAGAAAILQDPAGKVQGQAARYLGRATNNEAEYRAVLLGLEMAAGRGVKRLKIFTDSQLVAEQLKGGYQVKSPNLKPLWRQTLKELQKFEAYVISHLDRKLNSEADRLANRVIDQHLEKH